MYRFLLLMRFIFRMSVTSVMNKTVTASLGEKSLTLKPLTTRQLLSIVDLFNQVKDELGIKAETVKVDKDYLIELLKKFWTALRFENGQVVGPARILFDKLAELLGCSFDDFLDVPPDDIFSCVAALWEVNSTGPLGEQIRRIIATLKPLAANLGTNLTELLDINIQKARITALRSGMTDAGGMIVSSSPSSANSDGQTDTSLTDAPEFESSKLSQASDTLLDTNPPSSANPTNEASPAGELLVVVPATPTQAEAEKAT